MPAVTRSLSALPGIDSSRLEITEATVKRPKVPLEQLVFGASFTDHMLDIDWTASAGWGAPRIAPLDDLRIHPAASSLHYALQCFEGMKAYIDGDKRIRMFRPELNMARMNNSMQKVALPSFDGDEYLACMKELLKVEKEWIPDKFGYSLYIRPTGISTQPTLGVGPPQFAKLYTILSPVGPYYPEGFAPVTLLASTEHVRAWRGGVGNSKVGGNYAPTIPPAMEAVQSGYSQILWLGDGDTVTEVGTMNIFFLWHNEDGEKELVTPPLSMGTILPGVTRQSVLDLAHSWGDVKVSEREFTIHDVVEAIKAERVIEAFGAGTAAIVSPVKLIHFDGVDYDVPLNPDDASAGAGPFTQRVADTIMGIQYGTMESPVDSEGRPWSVIVD
eukprot:PLAT14364.1.p1 GENE.PLAT14364.1~~PLAT14364.1.p1  ORF type:complete len:411 (-),score=163.70 PLAT14364.1:170-1330(-)